jgi:hypothetical protein
MVLVKSLESTRRKFRNTKTTEPNQALQRTNMLVTDRAPSSTLRAKHVRR